MTDWIWEEERSEKTHDDSILKAKVVEIERMIQIGIYDVVDERVMEEDPEGIYIGTRWVITERDGVVKCRWVGQEFCRRVKKGRAIRRYTRADGLPIPHLQSGHK